MVPLRPTDSLWYAIYVESPDLTNQKFHQQFRTQFRCPYHKYLELLSLLKENELFHRWLSKDAIGCEASPIELLLLGTLRYLGCGWTFDDLEEQTAISREVNRHFFMYSFNLEVQCFFKNGCLFLQMKKSKIICLSSCWQVSVELLHHQMQCILVWSNVLIDYLLQTEGAS